MKNVQKVEVDFNKFSIATLAVVFLCLVFSSCTGTAPVTASSLICPVDYQSMYCEEDHPENEPD